MKIPIGFTDTQKAIFQDKKIMYYPAKENKGSLGSIITEPAIEQGITIEGVNVQIISDVLLAQEWGLTVGRDIVITCSISHHIEKGDFIAYCDDLYVVEGAPHADSHYKYMAKWIKRWT